MTKLHSSWNTSKEIQKSRKWLSGEAASVFHVNINTMPLQCHWSRFIKLAHLSLPSSHERISQRGAEISAETKSLKLVTSNDSAINESQHHQIDPLVSSRNLQDMWWLAITDKKKTNLKVPSCYKDVTHSITVEMISLACPLNRKIVDHWLYRTSSL